VEREGFNCHAPKHFCVPPAIAAEIKGSRCDGKLRWSPSFCLRPPLSPPLPRSPAWRRLQIGTELARCLARRCEVLRTFTAAPRYAKTTPYSAANQSVTRQVIADYPWQPILWALLFTRGRHYFAGRVILQVIPRLLVFIKLNRANH